MDYEVVIPAAPKDYNKLPYLFQSLHFLDPQPLAVHVIAPDTAVIESFKDITGTIFYWHDETKVLPGLDPMAAKHFRRPPWIFQQFLKLFQDVTKTDKYLVIDSDLILNRKLELFEEGKPKFFLGVDQNHPPYFRCSQETFGFGREYPHSFISEIMMFDKEVCVNLLQTHLAKYAPAVAIIGSYEEAIQLLYTFVTERACEGWIPADYEIYGNFVQKFYPGKYVKVHIKTNLKGKLQQNWSDDELREYVNTMKGQDYDFFTAHTWI